MAAPSAKPASSAIPCLLRCPRASNRLLLQSAPFINHTSHVDCARQSDWEGSSIVVCMYRCILFMASILIVSIPTSNDMSSASRRRIGEHQLIEAACEMRRPPPPLALHGELARR